MRGGFAFSIGVHALILALIILGLPFLRPKPMDLPPMISVELVPASKETTTNHVSPEQKVKKEPADETPPPEPPKPPPEQEPQPPKPETEPEPQPPQPQPREPMDPSTPKLAKVDDSVPQIETPDVDLKRPLPPAPKLTEVDDGVPKLAVPQEAIKHRLAAAPELAAVNETVPQLPVPAKVDLKRPAPKPTERSFDSVLKNLSKETPQEASDEPPQPHTKVATRAPSGAQAPLSSQLTASELSALSQQLGHCWNLPASAKDAQNLVVDLDVTINPDRTVSSVQVVDQERMASDSTYRIAADAAKRALRMTACTPLDLPPEKYQEWQSMTIHFDPKEMLGQ